MAKKDVNIDKKKNNFGKELKSEMKKVTWPTFKELVNSTVAVISIVLIVAAIVFVLDVCFENVNQFGVEKLKSLVSSSDEEDEDGIVVDDGTIELNDDTSEDEDGIELVPNGEATDNTSKQDVNQ